MIELYKIIIVIICLVFIVDRLKKRINKEPRQSLLKIFTTLFIWGGIIIITLIPSTYDHLMQLLGAKNDKNSLVLFGFIILLVFIYKILSIIERIEKNITEIIRHDSLKGIKKK
ncbi:MAG: DUF2304 domain-containing protein [Candidatus Levybacteria bacterium]|nr:DUF2304 domain-containing protein [Candidatus Levybacteria bacterium]